MLKAIPAVGALLVASALVLPTVSHAASPNSAVRETRQAIASGKDIDTAPDSVGLSERQKWTLFDEYHGHNVTQAFKELEWE
jgi:hypothetical protein